MTHPRPILRDPDENTEQKTCMEGIVFGVIVAAVSVGMLVLFCAVVAAGVSAVLF